MILPIFIIIAGLGVNANIGTIKQIDHPPYIVVDKSVGKIEYTYPTGN